MKNEYYKKIDILRVLLCLAILLFHLNILKGGFLAVCAFFTLSGFLITKSAYDKEKFSLIRYYKNRFAKIYLPLLVVVFATISVISFCPDVFWLNLKPETTSVIFGYNNFWQINSNLDYFSRSINSPFIHLWYIAIYLQFELIFPIIFLCLKKIGEKLHKSIPCIIMGLLSILGILYFYYISKSGNIVLLYYSTFTRVFSLLLGVTLGLIVNYYGNRLVFKNNKLSSCIFYLYLIILIFMFIYIDNSSKYFTLSMLLSSLITWRIIKFSLLDTSSLNKCDKVIKSASSLSYFIYLVQYPVIFLFQYVVLDKSLKLVLIFLLTIFISIIINFCINNKNRKLRVLKYLLSILILGVSIYGFIIYYTTKDHTEEMTKLKEQLVENQKTVSDNQDKYKEKMIKENEDWNSKLQELNDEKNNLGDVIKSLNVVGIGDSVMLGAVDNLYGMFPNGYFDAKISRTAWEVSGILGDLVSKNMVNGPIIINLGSNGDCSKACKDNIVKMSGDKDIFWINTTNLPTVNDSLLLLSKEYSNVHLIDWYTLSRGHEEYFYSDGIHLTGVGRRVYTKVIYDSIYDVYLDRYRVKQEEAIKNHEIEEKYKTVFYGNDILLNAYLYIEKDFEDANFIIDNGFNYNSLKNKILEDKNNNMLTHNVVLVFDSTFKINFSEYEDIINLCEDRNIIIVSSNKDIKELNSLKRDNVVVIDMYNEIQSNNNYLMADRIHLTEKGNQKMADLIKKEYNLKMGK